MRTREADHVQMAAARARVLARAPHLLAAGFVLAVALFAFSAATARASITLVGETHANTGVGASTITVNKPAGVQPGDVLAIGLNAGGGSIAAPPGWTVTWSSVAAYGYAIAAVKVAGSSEPSSYTFDLGTSRRATVGLTAWHGVEASTAGTNTKGFGWFFNSSSALTPATTTTTANNVILSGVTWTGAVTSTIPAGTTLLHTIQTAGGGSGVLTTQVAYSMQAAAGSVGSKTFTSSTSTSYGTLTDNFEPDITPPAAPSITSSPATPASDRNPSWSFTDEAYATFQCRLDSGSTVISGWASCTSPQSYSLFAQPDGVYTLSVKATDAAGNTGPTATSNYTLDTTPPAAPTIDSAPASPGSSRSPAWSFSDEPGATFQCQLGSGGTVISAWSSCTSGQAFDLTGRPDGAYTLSVKATDQAGNTGSVSTSTYSLDTTAPAAPTITVSPSSPSATRSPAWSFTDEPGATFQCQLAQGATVVSAWSACTSGQSFDLTGQPDGAYTLSVKATDTAGNTGAVSASSYTLDTTAPAAPAITATPTSPGATRSPAWSFSGEAGATYTCQIDRSGTVISAWASCTSGQSFSLFAQPDGVYTFSVRATDQAGNTGSPATSSYTLDTTAPAAPTIDSAPASPSNSRSAAWSFSDEAGATLQCQLDRGGTVVSAWAPCTSGQAFDLTGQPDGVYTFSVKATDTAGNTGGAATSTYTLDTSAPPAPTITSAPSSPGTTRSPAWSFTDEAGATFQCQLTRGGTVVSAWSSCTSGQSFDLTGQPDGSYTVSVKATDTAGNTGAAATSTYTLDTTAPAAPTITSAPASPASDRTPSWSFSAEPGVSIDCKLTDGATVISDWASCSSPKSYSLAGLPDSTYTLSLRATDAAGNTSGVSTSSYTLDSTAPPAPTITAMPSSPGQTRAPAWSFSSASATSYKCRIDRGATQVQAWAACTSGQTFDLTGQPDATYTLSVEALDGIGNTSAAATSDYTLDTTAPAAPTITSAPTSPGATRAPAWFFSDEPGASFSCRIDRGATQVQNWAPCSSGQTFDLTGQPDGTYKLSVEATDLAGNTGGATTSTYTLDTTAPAAPSITSSPASPATNRSPAWSFSAEAGATLQCRLDRGATQVYDWGACLGSQSYDLTGQPDGTYTFSIRATDAAGNTSATASSGYVLDTSPPAAPTITSAPSSPGNSRAPAWSFSGEPGASLRCRIDRGGTQVQGWVACTSGQTFDLTGQPDGNYTLSVEATDVAGNTGSAATSDYVLDTTAPAAPTFTSTPGASGSSTTPAWSFSDEPGASFSCRIDRGATQIDGWAPCSSGQTFDLSGRPDGSYTLTVKATDVAGNTGATSSSTYTLDTGAPAAPLITASPSSPAQDRNPGWSFSGEAGAGFSCRLTRGGTVVADWSSCTSPQSFVLMAQPDGVYTFSVKATDQAGNTGATATSTYTLDTTAPAAPTITSAPVSPGSGDHPAWSFAAESGAGFKCQLARGGTVVYAWTACTSGQQWDLSGAPDGTYTLSVTATDQAGNESAAATSSYDYDRTPPAAPTITSSPGASGTSLNPAWSFTGEAGATFECRLDRGGTVVSDWASCPAPQSYDLSAQPDGTYTFSVRARDAAGNPGPAATSDYTMNTSRPPAPTIDGPPSTPGNSTAPSWRFSSTEGGDTFRCQLLHGGTVEFGWAACSSPQSYDLVGKPDGTYTLEVEARNGVGTTGPSTTSDYVLDTVAPSTPTIDSSPASPRPNRSPAWTFSSDPDASFDCKLTRGGAVVSDWAACASGQAFDLTGQPDGTYTLTVRGRDAAGNTSGTASSDFTLDSTAPPVPSIVSSPGAIAANVSPVWGFSAEPGATLECLLSRGVTTVSDWSACGSPRGYSLIGQPDGDYSFEVRATDAAGNVSAPAVSAYELLAALPGMPAITSAPAPLGNDRSPAWAFTVAAGSTAECRIERGQTAISDWSPCATARTYDLSGQPDGQYTFSVRARNAAATVSDAVTSTYVLDTTPPAAPKIESRPDSAGSDRTPRWTFSGEDGATFECRLKPLADWSSCAKAKSYDLTREQNGNFTFAVRATDRAGNTGAAATDGYTLNASSAPGGAATPAPPAPGSQNPPAGNPPAPNPSSTPGSPQTPATPHANPSRSRAKPPAHNAVARGANTLRGAIRGVVPSARRHARAAAGTSSAHHKTHHRHNGALASVTQSVAKVARVVAKNADKAVFPGFLIFIVAGFLSIQGRIDRNDPKLALAPTYADPDLDFGPPPGDE